MSENQENQVVALEVRATEALSSARQLRVTDQPTLTVANTQIKTMKDMMDEIASVFDPILDKQKAALAETKATKGRFYEPLAGERERLRKEIGVYLLAQEEERKKKAEEAFRAEQERIRREAEKKEVAEEAMAMAEEAEKKGDKKLADEFLGIAAEAEAEAKVVVAETVVPEVPVTNGIHMRANWVMVVDDEKLVPREYWSLNLVMLNAVARAQKGGTRIPGCHAENRPVAVQK